MLQFIEVEKRIHDSLLFPSFSLQVAQNEITSIYSSVNIREQLIQLLRLQTTPSYGEILTAFRKKSAILKERSE